MKAMYIFSKKNFISIISLVLLAAGCASTPPFRPATPESDSALIYLYRPSSIVGAGNHYLAAVNGQVVARMKSGSYYVLDYPPGEIVISSKVDSALGWWGPGVIVGALQGFIETERFKAAGGSKYFIHFPSGKLNSNEEKALKDMGGTDLLPQLKKK